MGPLEEWPAITQPLIIIMRKKGRSRCSNHNGRNSFQLCVGVFDTCPVCYLLVLPSETHAVPNMTSLWAIDGDTSYHSYESFLLTRHQKLSTAKCQLYDQEETRRTNS